MEENFYPLRLNFDLFIGLLIKKLFFSSCSIFVVPAGLVGLIIGLLLFEVSNRRRLTNYIVLAYFSFFVYYLSLTYLYNQIGLNCFFIYEMFSSNFLMLSLPFSLDIITLMFLCLVSFILFICVLNITGWSAADFRHFAVVVSFLYLILIFAFSTRSILYFFIFFESTLMPMFYIINRWGRRQRRIHANYYFLLYTITGSSFLFIGILLLFGTVGSFNVDVITEVAIGLNRQIMIWALLFIGFAAKLPLPPLHSWLPEAHVEASATGSIILAAILLKMGAYGILRFMLPILPFANIYFTHFVMTISAFTLLYASILAIRQTDLKKMVAYSSIAHMSIITAGLFAQSHEAICGSVFFMISHGFISAGLFFTIGAIYARTHTRSINNIGDLSRRMPLLSFFFFLFSLANIGFPLTSGFIGELLIFIYIFNINLLVGLIYIVSTILTATYSIWLCTRILFGSGLFKKDRSRQYCLCDLNRYELLICVLLFIPILLFGLCPSNILGPLIFISALHIN